MKYKTLHILFLLWTQFLSAQKNDIWIRFIDNKTELSGYKDLYGNIKIPAKFNNLTEADSFYNIIAVTEEVDSSSKSYYLLKDGRKIGQDSVFSFDFTYDCESEGKILFQDHTTGRVGFFDKNGTVAIPAIYNEAGSFFNGVALALKNAKRKCWGILGRDTDDTSDCEHLIWRGGETVLINTKNEVLINNWTIDRRLVNWYSMKVNDPAVDTSIFFSVEGENNNVYSFINYEKEYNRWFYADFLPGLKSNDKKKIGELCFEDIAMWSDDRSMWSVKSKEDFLKVVSTQVPLETFQSKKLNGIFIERQYFNDIDWDFTELNAIDSCVSKLYHKFFTPCGSYFEEKYPIFKVTASYNKKQKAKLPWVPGKDEAKTANAVPDEKLEIFFLYFVRTAAGYKLINVALKMGETVLLPKVLSTEVSFVGAAAHSGVYRWCQ